MYANSEAMKHTVKLLVFRTEKLLLIQRPEPKHAGFIAKMKVLCCVLRTGLVGPPAVYRTVFSLQCH